MSDAPATKRDLEELKLGLRAEIGELRRDFEEHRLATKRDLEELKLGLRAEIGELRRDFEEHRLATKRDLEELKLDLETRLASKRDLEELKLELETRLASKRDLEELRRDFEAFEKRVVQHISEATMHAVTVVMESLRSQVAAVDDKYLDVPRNHAALRSDVEAHIANTSIHVAPKRRRAR